MRVQTCGVHFGNGRLSARFWLSGGGHMTAAPALQVTGMGCLALSWTPKATLPDWRTGAWDSGLLSAAPAPKEGNGLKEKKKRNEERVDKKRDDPGVN